MTNTSVDSWAAPLPPGTEAPDFELPSAPNETVSLGEFRGQPVILAFYPGDWSPVCSDQLALYQEVLDAIATHRVADRPDRFEPRLKKRRKDYCGWFTKPRAELKRQMAKGLNKR